ncbi:MAG: acyl-CoA dehydrogenase [Gammaproteobacteria bacterium]|nr:acyl-CoA dehydrogenase [Gammaproteobacteria bacterium]
MIIIVVAVLLLGFLWLKLPLKNWMIASVVVLLLTMITGLTSLFFSLLFILVFSVTCVLLFFAPSFRKQYVSLKVFELFRQKMPPVSRTEQEAIDAGTVWWEAELFSGTPNWEVLFGVPRPALSEEEKRFLDGPAAELCEMVDDWEVTHELNDLPAAAWDFIREKKFFALNASREYGGLGFSAHAQSCIIQKLASRSATLAATVMVPNSLGPAELIFHYGTDEQKSRYLPRLAAGKEIPCFGLTNPWAGSDAAGMPDCGVVCRGKYKRKNVLGFRVNWEKRYITLGPVATLLGLAFRGYDPDHLLGDEEELGITCALVPTGTRGVSIGARHLPLNMAFQNGPNWGKDVFIPMDWIIGGQEQVGQGWRMLMESLAAGRGISLPAAATGAAKMAARTSGAYAQVREQFGIPIGRFEGIEEVLARIGGRTYLLDSARTAMTSALSLGERPAVLSAIAKQQCTDLSRMVINDAMDLHGGKGICLGPGNYLARAYQQVPIGITVEGANILTRSLIIFGQGSIRCHPHLLKEMQAISREDESEGLDEFDRVMAAHVEHAIGNKIRSFCFGLSRSTLATGYGSGMVRKHTRAIEHFSASFAWLADVTLVMLGGELKRREMLSGRFADVLGNLYLASAAVKRFRDSGEPEEDLAVADWACRYALYRAQQGLDGILRNYPRRIVGKMLRVAIFAGGRYLDFPDDELSRKVARGIQTPGGMRDRLTEDVHISHNREDMSARIEHAFESMVETVELRKRLKESAVVQPVSESHGQWVDALQEEGLVTPEEAESLVRTRELVRSVIQVDHFNLDQPV